MEKGSFDIWILPETCVATVHREALALNLRAGCRVQFDYYFTDRLDAPGADITSEFETRNNIDSYS